MNDEIRIEVGLVNYLAYLGCVSFDSIIDWSSTHYNDDPCFELVVNESATIREAIEMLNNVISAIPVSDDLKLAIIADDYLNRSSDVLMAVSKAYEMLNLDGDGDHMLSQCLYELVDNPYDSELKNIARAKNIFIPKLTEYYTLYAKTLNCIRYSLWCK